MGGGARGFRGGGGHPARCEREAAGPGTAGRGGPFAARGQEGRGGARGGGGGCFAVVAAGLPVAAPNLLEEPYPLGLADG